MDKIEFHLRVQDPSSEGTSSEETEMMTARSRATYSCHPLLTVNDAHYVRNVTPPVQGKNSLAGFWNSEPSETTYSKGPNNTQGQGQGPVGNQFQSQQYNFNGTILKYCRIFFDVIALSGSRQ